MLYKKMIVLWSDCPSAIEDASEFAVKTAREWGNVVAYGLQVAKIDNPEDDPDFDCSVDRLLLTD
jgi:hypothetical protein